MNKEVANKLMIAIDKCCANFSRPDREHNHTNETFEFQDVAVSTSNAAVVSLIKNTGKLALFFFYYMRGYRDGEWRWFAVSYDHIPAMEKVSDAMLDVEKHNYNRNFDGGDK